jgi:hypothetical protein
MMRAVAAACLVVLTFSACEKRGHMNNAATDETGSRTSADTVVTKREMQDTAVISHDTTVSTDTTKMKGDRPVDTDTVQKK